MFHLSKAQENKVKTEDFVLRMRTGLCLMAGVAAMCSLKAETQQSDCDVYMVTQDDGQFSSFTRGEHRGMTLVFR